MEQSVFEQQHSVLLYMHREEADGRTVTIGDIRQLLGSDDSAAAMMTALTERGRVRRGNRDVGDYYLTLDGKAEAQSAIQRQSDRGHRRTHCRDRVLSWLDNSGRVGEFSDPQGFSGVLDGLPFSDDEVHEALDFLIEKGLARGGQRMASGEFSLVAITSDGSECIDSSASVSAYLAERRAGAGSQSTSFHVAGTGHTFATATADGARVTANVTNHFTVDGARLFARAVEVAANDLGLDDGARAAVTTIEQTDDPAIARRAATVLYNFVVAAGAGTVGQILGLYGADLLGIL